MEAVEASLCYFFENWLIKHKIPTLLKPLGTIIHQNSQFYCPSEPVSFHHFNVRHPVYNLHLPSFIDKSRLIPTTAYLGTCKHYILAYHFNANIVLKLFQYYIFQSFLYMNSTDSVLLPFCPKNKNQKT